MASLIKTPTKTNPLLARYLLALATRPLLTKCITSGILSFVQEVLASHLAGVPFNVSRNAPAIEQLLATAKVDMRAFKMAIYGFFVSAPMGHYLMGALQKAFAGKTGRASKIGQLAASNLIIAPIQTFVFLSCMAIISGAQTTEAVLARVKGGFRKMITAS
ncbi:hypothetical protein FRC03_008602 [Tulasnella sp. 419]|nr:hypothetical protein FRC02_009998 [Tulasnella sp. 418]KAG8970405.1 hypothetical protein FRC03_008602 [Tulasnella sp. 419]